MACTVVANGMAMLCPAPLGGPVLVLGSSFFPATGMALGMTSARGKQRVGVLQMGR